MTVQQIVPYAKYVTNGADSVYTVNFFIEDKENLFIKLNDVVVSMNDYNYLKDVNGIEFHTPLLANQKLEIFRKTKLERTTNFESFNNTFRPEVLNKDLDKIWLTLQEQSSKVDQYDLDYEYVVRTSSQALTEVKDAQARADDAYELADLTNTEIRPIPRGGTGANNASDARNNLDVHSKAEVLALVQTGGAGEVLSIESGGTSGVTAEEARTNLDVYSKDEIDAKGIYPVGSIRWWNGKASMIPDGCVPLSGTLLNRASYPDLWADIQAGVYDVIEDTVWLSNPDRRWAFSVGDGSTTFRLPDYNGIQSGSIKSPVLRGSGYSNPSIKSDAIRNITGSVNAIRMGIGWTPQSTGALLGKSAPNSGDANNGSAATMTIDIDASRVVPTADENRPNSLFGIWIIQARGTTRQAPAQGSSATLLSNTFDGNQKINGDLEVTGTLNANIKPLLNAQGDAPISACRAWACFNGITGTIKASLNVQSITKNATGDYTLNFISAMPHSNYFYAGGVTSSSVNTNSLFFGAYGAYQSQPVLKTTSQFRIICANTTRVDVEDMTIGVFC